jgi:tetratricopeptide (TPR) repeat protein
VNAESEHPPPTIADGQKATVQHSIERAVRLLQNGESETADAELHAVLAERPGNKSARFLLAQIETPIGKLFPHDSFAVKLGKKQKLSNLASLYLGNSFAFYGLARFNGIPVPAKVHEGQTIRIPRTPASLLAAQKQAGGPPLRLSGSTSDGEIASLAAIEASAPDADAVSSPAQRKSAERFYHAGLIAFQRQDLARAIAQWQKAVAADRTYLDARLSLAQAEKLQQNLQQLQK